MPAGDRKLRGADFTLFGKWCEEGVFWVTRMNDGTSYELVESRGLPEGGSILADEIVILSGTRGVFGADAPTGLRRAETKQG